MKDSSHRASNGGAGAKWQNDRHGAGAVSPPFNNYDTGVASKEGGLVACKRVMLMMPLLLDPQEAVCLCRCLSLIIGDYRVQGRQLRCDSVLGSGAMVKGLVRDHIVVVEAIISAKLLYKTWEPGAHIAAAKQSRDPVPHPKIKSQHIKLERLGCRFRRCLGWQWCWKLPSVW